MSVSFVIVMFGKLVVMDGLVVSVLISVVGLLVMFSAELTTWAVCLVNVVSSLVVDILVVNWGVVDWLVMGGLMMDGLVVSDLVMGNSVVSDLVMDRLVMHFVVHGLVVNGLVVHNSLVVNDGDDMVNDGLVVLFVMRGSLVMDGSIMMNWGVVVSDSLMVNGGLVVALLTVIVAVGAFMVVNLVVHMRCLVALGVIWLVAHLVDWLVGLLVGVLAMLVRGGTVLVIILASLVMHGLFVV